MNDLLKVQIKNRVKCCEKSGAHGESELWQRALNEIEQLELRVRDKSAEIVTLNGKIEKVRGLL